MNLYDRYGRPFAYSDDGEHIYSFSGKPLAYVRGDSIYRPDGRHAGFLDGGKVVDPMGNTLLFTDGASSGPLKPLLGMEPLKGFKAMFPMKGLPQMPPMKPWSTLSWSQSDPASIFG